MRLIKLTTLVVGLTLAGQQAFSFYDDAATELEGNWVLSCSVLGDISVTGKLSIKGNTFKDSFNLYSDRSCADLKKTLTAEGRFELQKKDEKSDVQGIDWILADKDGAETRYLDVFQMNAEKNRLYFSASANKSKRPTKVNRDIEFVKQTGSLTEKEIF